MAFVFTADNHLDTRGFREDVPAEDGFWALEQIRDYCLENNLPLVQGGDLFDKNRPPSWVVNRAMAILAPIKQLYYVQGNHDKDATEPWMNLHASAIRLGLDPIDVGGHKLCGIDYNPTGVLGDLIAQVPSCDGLVLHQALRQGLGFEGAWNWDLEDCDPARYRNVWIGDLHSEATHWACDQRMRAVYPGSSWMRSIDESPEPGFLHVHDELEDGHYVFTRQPLMHRPLVKLQLESDADLLAVLERDSFIEQLSVDSYPHIPEAFRKPILHVRYYGDIRGVEEAFRELLDSLGGGIYVETVLPARREILNTVLKIDMGDEALSLSKLISKTVTDPGALDVRSLALELAACQTTGQVQETIAQWRERYLPSEQTTGV